MRKVLFLLFSALLTLSVSAARVIEQVATHVTTTSAYDIAVSPDGKSLYVVHSASDYTIQIFDAKTLIPGAKLQAPYTKNTYGGAVAVDGNGKIYGTFVRISNGNQVIYRWNDETSAPAVFCQIANVGSNDYRTGYGMDVRVDAQGNGFLILPAPTNSTNFSAAGSAVYYVPITNNVAGTPQFVLLSSSNWGVYPKVRIISDTQFWYDGNAGRPQLITIANNAGTISVVSNLLFPYKSNPTIYGAAMGMTDFTFKDVRYALIAGNNHGSVNDAAKNAMYLYSMNVGSTAITASFIQHMPEGGLGTATSSTSHQTAAYVGDKEVWMYTSAVGTGNKICAFKMYDDTDLPVTGVSLSDLTMAAGMKQTINATITPSNAGDQTVKWSSSAPAVATINATTGQITALKAGTTILKAISNDGGFEATCTLTVVDAVAHIFAYELNRTLHADELGYTFSFKANMAATAGALVFYQEGVEKGRVSLSSVVKGENNVSLAKVDMPQVEGVMTWGVELSAAANEVFGPVYTGEARFARGHAVVDASPESNYFGRIYVADRRTTAANGGLFVYQPDYTKVNTTAYKLGRTASNYSRPAIDAEGTLYLGDYADGTSGVYVVNPTDLTTCTQLYEGTRAPSGLFSKNSVAVGGSIAGLAIYGEGANTMLYSSQEDMTPGNVIVGYRLGQTDGTIAHSWGVAPTVNYSSVVSKSTTNQGGNNAIAATDKGLWVSQNRNADNGTTTRNLIFISNAGTVTYTSTGSSFNGCLGGGVAVNKTNDRLYIVGAQGKSVLKEYSITWAGNTPTLTLLHTYAWGYDAASTLHFDYAGNLVACVGTSYGGTDANVMRLVVFSTPTENNTTLVPAKKALTVESTTHVDVTSVTINETDQTLEKGLTLTLTATVLPANATDPTITWESDNTSVATVSPEGLVLAVNAGEAHITATADGVTSAPITITVFKADFDITWEPNGATVKMTAPATNVDLWNQFMADYNAYYTARGYGQRASQPITAVRVFLNNKIKDFMTDEDSPWKWLGDHILSVATAGGRTLDTEVKWSFDVMAFFNASAAVSGDYGNADFTTAGQVATWLPLWKEANNYLPLTLRATDAIPAIHKENATFEGWYDNAALTGDAVISVTHDITLYAKWRNSLTLKDTETTTTLLTAYEGQVADVVVKRNFVAGTGWYTLSLPFSLDAAQTAAVFGSGAEFATLSDAYNKTGDMMYLQFDYVDALEAGVPYLFMPAMDMTEIAVEGVTIDPTLRPVLTSLADFRGLFQRTTFTGEAGSPIYFMGEENMLVQLGVNNFTSNAYRCYFRLDPSIAALNTRARVVFGPQVATDMEQIGSEDEVQKVLKNGQIYILKNGHTYTTTGMLVE